MGVLGGGVGDVVDCRRDLGGRFLGMRFWGGGLAGWAGEGETADQAVDFDDLANSNLRL